MDAHVIKDGIITNTIIVDSLDDLPNLIDATHGGTIGDLWDGSKVIKNKKPSHPQYKTVDSKIKGILKVMKLKGVLTEQEVNEIENQ